MKNAIIRMENVEKIGRACGKCRRIFSKDDDKGGNYYYCKNCCSVRRGVLVLISKTGEVFEASDWMVVEYIKHGKESKEAA